jgi:hypothetical protein
MSQLDARNARLDALLPTSLGSPVVEPSPTRSVDAASAAERKRAAMSTMRFTVATLALFAGSTAAFADQPGADWLTIDQVKQKLMDAGYTEISELEADDGNWEGEGIKNGQMMDFHIDPHSGEFTKEEIDR